MDDAAIFAKNKKNIDYYISNLQLFTAHSIFNAYRKRINKDNNIKCWECVGEPDKELWTKWVTAN